MSTSTSVTTSSTSTTTLPPYYHWLQEDGYRWVLEDASGHWVLQDAPDPYYYLLNEDENRVLNETSDKILLEEAYTISTSSTSGSTSSTSSSTSTSVSTTSQSTSTTTVPLVASEHGHGSIGIPKAKFSIVQDKPRVV